MSVPASLDDLLQLIRTSGMVDEPTLSGYVSSRSAEGQPLPTDAKTAAEQMVRDGLITEFQREQFLMGKWRGFTIGKYKLLERVGVGGMGQVFLCEHMFMKRHVAIKVLPPAKAEQPSALGRFYREARAAGSIEHPNIVRTFDIDQDGNLHYIVMEYVDGTNLLDIVKQFGKLDIARAVDYAYQVAVGLEYAYRSGIIHRDVKPGNVLITRHGEAKILDMGLARFYRDTSDQLTVQYDDKIVLGTADYVAPEQVANSHGADTRADVYALGATLYYLLTGQPPFPAGTVSQKLLWHRTKDPTPIRELRPEVPEGLAALIAKMMKKDPALRQQTPGEVALELKPYIPQNVPLPTEAEMPRLSPAAQKVMEAEEEVPLTAETPSTPGSGLHVRVPAGVAAGSQSGKYDSINPPAVGRGLSGTIPVGSSTTRPSPFAASRSPFGPPDQSDVPTVNTTAQATPTGVETPPFAAPPPASFPVPAASEAADRNPLLIPFLIAVVVAGLAILALVAWIVFGQS